MIFIDYDTWRKAEADRLPELRADIRLIDIRCRKIGGAHTSESFSRNAAYHGVPNLRCGHRVRFHESEGIIIGWGGAGYFAVLFVSGRFAGRRSHVHPLDLELIEVPA